MKNLLIIFGLLVNSLHGQMSYRAADSIWLKFHPELNKLQPFNQDSVRIYFTKMLNGYRLSNGLNSLKIDSLLKPVADDQLNYVAKLGEVTHEQPTKGKKSPSDRFKFYGLNSVSTGENLIKNTFYKNYRHFEMISQFKSNSISYMYAKTLFEGWKTSVGHNKLMLTENYNKFYFDIKIVEIEGQTFLYGIILFEETE
jgi:uncharacterized protein YkwD